MTIEHSQNGPAPTSSDTSWSAELRSLISADEQLWLEDIDGAEALDWVQTRNEESNVELASSPRFDRVRRELHEMLDSADRIPQVGMAGEWLINFWCDAEHPRGIWRRITMSSFRSPTPDWETLLDIDELAREEEENWVWAGASLLRPDMDRALIRLSRGGSDAASVREFDLTSRVFIEGASGFTLPEAKSNVQWVGRDEILVGTNFGPESMTDSGYARAVKRWRRGTPLTDAKLLFEAEATDMGAWGWCTPGIDGGPITVGVERKREFFTSENFVVRDGSLVRVPHPEDADVDFHHEWVVIRLRSPWRIGGHEYTTGSVVVADLDDLIDGRAEPTLIFEPDERSSFGYHSWTRNHLLVQSLVDVRSRLEVHTPGADGWSRRLLPGAPAIGQSDIAGTDPHTDDGYLIISSGFTEPPTLRMGNLSAPDRDVRILSQAPPSFDATGVGVEQHFAISADGTRIPYFVARTPGDSPSLTLLEGYGGFEQSLTESYNPIIGKGWLEQGHTFVRANIRGGGEYGPRWHQAGLTSNRLRVYEDFAAVAADLVSRGITTVDSLAIRGGSNGGLLMGVMLTRYPELFGAIVCEVPLLDMLRYDQLLAGASWVSEFGSPRDAEQGPYLRGYSPYHNLRTELEYPPTLIMTSTRDDRVHPGHARKMVARMRSLSKDVSYFENTEGGHGGAANNEQIAYKWALVFEFLRRRLRAVRES